MPALQARRLRHAFVLQVRIEQGEELVEERATGFTKTAKWHDCDKAALLWHVLTASTPMLPPEGGTTCWSALAIPHRRKHRCQLQAGAQRR